MNTQNYNSVLADWEKRQQQEKEAAFVAVKPILQRLKNQGVETIHATYNGAGDSGCIDVVELFPDNTTPLSSQEQETIEGFILTCLPDGWEINEGSEGDFFIDLKQYSTRIEHYWFQPTLDDSLSGLKFSLSEKEE